MQIAALPVREALAVLNSTASGLSTTEASRRLGEFGPNRIEAPPGRPLWLRFADEFTHFFALILWLAAGLALVAEALAPGEGMLELAAAIVGVIAVNGSFSFWQEYRAERALEALRRLLPQQVEVLRDGAPRRVDAAEVVPGDVVLLAAGDRVPADCRLTEAFAVRVDLSTLSGESMAMARAAEPDTQPKPLAARSLLLAGTALLSGQARALVYATGMRTQFGRIAHLTQTTRDVRSPLQLEIARVSHLVTMLATTLGIAFFVIGTTIGLGFWGSAMFGIGIIVANVPEGLLPTVTLALALATQRMARRNALVRHLPAVEALGSASVIVSDKTGTLTQNRMTVRQLFNGGAVLRAEDRDAAQARRMRRALEVMRSCCSGFRCRSP
jgi:sodium/potassium-transporting ATPase subunit alpha